MEKEKMKENVIKAFKKELQNIDTKSIEFEKGYVFEYFKTPSFCIRKGSLEEYLPPEGTSITFEHLTIPLSLKEYDDLYFMIQNKIDETIKIKEQKSYEKILKFLED